MKRFLDQRLREVTCEREALQQRLEHLDRIEQALQLLIVEETRRPTATQLTLSPAVSNGNTPIGTTETSRFILESLAAGGDIPLGTLAESATAKGIDFGEKNPKRVLHFTLIGLERNGYALRNGDGTWRITPKALDNMPPKEKQENHRSVDQ